MRTTCALAGVLVCAGCMTDRELGKLAATDPLDTRTVASADPPPVAAPAPPLAPPPTITVGPLMKLDTDAGALGPASIAWTGTDWVVSWQEGRVAYVDPSIDYRLTAFGLPLIGRAGSDASGFSFELDERGMKPTGIGYDAELGASGGYVMALSLTPYTERPGPRQGDTHGRVVALDTAGMRLGRFDFGMAETTALARASELGAWAVLLSRNPWPEQHHYQLILLDNAMNPLGPALDVRPAIGVYSNHPAKLLSVDDKVIIVLQAANGIQIRTFVGRALAEPDPAVILPIEGMGSDPLQKVQPIAAARVGDAVVIATKDGNSTRTWSYQPSTRTVTDGPSVVGPGAPSSGLSIAGDSQGGKAGICFPAGREQEPYDPVDVKFALVGPDGRPLVQPVTIVESIPGGLVSCDIAAGQPGEYFLAVFHAWGGDNRPRLLGTRVVVTAPKPTID